jgi:transcription antitermination factor NusG
MKESKNWYVVYTKPKLEKRVAEQLERKNIPTYLPESNKLQYLLGRKRVVRIPLLPLLLFVFADEKQLAAIINTDGVSGVLYKFQKPAIIPNKEIAMMQRFLTEHNDVVIEKVPLGYVGDNVAEVPTQQEEVYFDKYYQTEKVYLPSFGYAVSAKSEKIVLNKVA